MIHDHIAEWLVLAGLIRNFKAAAPIVADRVPPDAWSPVTGDIYAELIECSLALDPDSGFQTNAAIVWKQIQAAELDDREEIKNEWKQIIERETLELGSLALLVQCDCIARAYQSRLAESEFTKAAQAAAAGADPESICATVAELRCQFGTSFAGVTSFAQRFPQFIDWIAEPVVKHPFATGFQLLDEHLDALEPGHYLIISGRRKTGKSTFALQILIESIKLGCAGALFSFEMTERIWMMRACAYLTRIPVDAFRRHNFTPEQSAQISRLPADFSGFIDRLHICELRRGARIEELIADTRRLIRKYPQIKLIAIDYAQLINGGDHQQNRQQQLSDVSSKLAQLAKDLGVLLIAVAQLNQNLDTRESTSFENDCDGQLKILDDTKTANLIPDSEPDAQTQRSQCKIIALTNWRHGLNNQEYPAVFLGQFGRFEPRGPKLEPDNVIQIPRKKPSPQPPKSYRADLDG